MLEWGLIIYIWEGFMLNPNSAYFVTLSLLSLIYLKAEYVVYEIILHSSPDFVI